MEQKASSPLAMDRLFHWFLALLVRHRYGILGSLTAGFLAHMYVFTNKLPNHDDAYFLFAKGNTLNLGRWGLIPLSEIFPDYSMPWICGVVSLLILTVCVCLILRLFRIKTPLVQTVLAGIIVSFPSQTAIFSYMFTGCVFATSFLLSVIAVWLMRRGGWIRYAGAVVLLICSLSIYQAYIAMAATLLILLLLRDLIAEGTAPGKLFLTGLSYVAVLAVSMGLYWGITNVLWSVTGVHMNEYADYALTLSLSSVFDSIRNAYIAFRDTFLHSSHGLVPTFLSRYIHYACFLAVGAELVLWVLNKRKELPRLALLAFLLVMLPLGINAMYIIFNPDSIHTLVQYAYIGIYILFACSIENIWGEFRTPELIGKLRALARECLVIAMLFITVTNVYVANEAYLGMQLAYDNTHSIVTTTITHVQDLPGFTTDSTIAVIGTYQKPEYYDTHFSRQDKIMGTAGVLPNMYSIEQYWEFFHGFPMNAATTEQLVALAQTPEYAAMPAWPEAGYIQWIGDTIVIKFS